MYYATESNAALCHPPTTRVERTANNQKHYEQRT